MAKPNRNNTTETMEILHSGVGPYLGSLHKVLREQGRVYRLFLNGKIEAKNYKALAYGLQGMILSHKLALSTEYQELQKIRDSTDVELEGKVKQLLGMSDPSPLSNPTPDGQSSLADVTDIDVIETEPAKEE